MRRGDVQEAQFVGAGSVIGYRAFDGVTCIAQIDEINALDDAPVLDVEARNETLLKQGRSRGIA